jgi:hypothetical protein
MIKTFIMRQKTKINSRYWLELTIIVNYFRNKQFVTNKNVILYEIHINRKLKLNHLRRVRQTDFAQVRKSIIEWKKFQKRNEKCVLIEYEENHIYRMINSKKNTTIRHRKMNKLNCFVNSLFYNHIKNVKTINIRRNRFVSKTLHARYSTRTHDEWIDKCRKKQIRNFLRVNFHHRFHDHFFVFVLNFILTKHSKFRIFSSDFICFFITIENQKLFESKTYKKIMICSNRNKWIKMIKNEHDFFMINKTWRLIDLSLNRKSLEDKWIFKFKRNFHEEILRYKTRWVIRDFEQRKSVNYHETYASIIKSMSYKFIFVIAVVRNWKLEQMNIKTMFFYKNVNEKIYVK